MSGGEAFADKSANNSIFLTPAKVLEPVRAYFGLEGQGAQIRLDPATEASNPTKAALFYTEKLNGLDKPWVDATFVNPPYGQALYDWVPKIAKEASEGHLIVALLPGQRFEQPYWLDNLVLHNNLTAIVFIVQRLQFMQPDGVPLGGNPYGSMLYVFNGHYQHVARAFQAIGAILEPGRRTPWKPPQGVLPFAAANM